MESRIAGKSGVSERTSGQVWLLRSLGVINFSAIVAVMAPDSWLAGCHEWLGLGSFPTGSITGYLARSTSLWFAAFGLLLWFVSVDVVRYSSLIAFVGWAMIIQGGCMVVIDWHQGLPAWWIVAEGPSCICLGTGLVVMRSSNQTTREDGGASLES